MLASNDKISTRQAIILFFMITVSPGIRFFPQFSASMAGKAGWLIPIAAAIPMVLLIYILNVFFKKYKEENLSNIYFKISGNVVGTIIIFLYLIWVLILLTLNVRYYAERLLSSILPNTSIGFLIISMLIMVFYAARSGLVPIARVNEVFFTIFVVAYIFTLLLALPGIKYRNFMLVSHLDIWPVVKGSYGVLAVWGYLLLIFFFGDKINDKEHIKKFGFQGLFLKCVFSLSFLIMTIGTLGPMLATHVSLPFFITVKGISVLGVIERIESILLTLWIMSDFVLITVFVYIAITLIQSLFNLSGTKAMVSPVIMFAGIGSLFLAKDRFELESFSKYVALPINMTFEFIIPIILFGVGKLRKKI